MRALAFRLTVVLVFTLPWENVVLLPGIGRVSKLVGLLVAAVWVASVVVAGRVREPKASHVFALLFVLWNACSMLWTVDGPATQERVTTYAQLVVLMLVLWDTVTTLRAARQLLLTYVLGCYVSVGALLYGYLFPSESSHMYGRVTVAGFHPNDVGMILALGVPIAAYFIGTPGPERWRRARLTAMALYVPLSGLAVLLTGSRSALLAMAPGLFYLGYLLARWRPRLAFTALGTLGVLAFLAIPLLPSRVLFRLSGTADAVESGDLNHREQVWAEAIRLFLQDPVTGSGSGAFKAAAVSVNRVGHNFVFALLAEVGAVGLLLFLAVIVSSILPLARTSRVLRGMWLALFTAWVFGALLQNLEYRKQTWVFLGLMTACGYLTDDRVRRRASRDTPTGHGASP